MVTQKKVVESKMPMHDDSWWASVLADEQRHSFAPKGPPAALTDRKESPLNWRKAQALYKQDSIISLRVTGHNRGGVLVEGDGLNGFVPCSHLVGINEQGNMEEREKVLSKYIDQTLKLKVIECVPDDGRVVFSERAAQAGAGRRRELFSTLQKGQCIAGEVTNITDFGAFIDLGGVEGLVHISELSWGRVSHPGEIVEVRQRVNVQVLEISPERCRVALSMKRLLDNPWDSADKTYLVGQIVSARITSVVTYGAFARLDEGLEGLIHASEMPLKDGSLPRDLLNEGEIVQARLLNIDPAKQRMGLSMKLDE